MPVKKITYAVIAILAGELFAVPPAPAQGTLSVSNLGQTPVGKAAIGNNSWIAQEFFTGTNSGGYTLNSIQLLMDASSGSPSGFAVSIYSGLFTGPPESSLGNLVGSLNPTAGGLFSYTNSGITLSPGSSYFVVVTAATPVAQGAYFWSAGPMGDTFGDDRWTIGHLYFTSTDGLNWSHFRDQYFQMAIYSTALPEPSASWLLLLGSGVLAYTRIRKPI